MNGRCEGTDKLPHMRLQRELNFLQKDVLEVVRCLEFCADHTSDSWEIRAKAARILELFKAKNPDLK